MRDAFQRVAFRGVVGQRGARDASVNGLVRGEEPALGLGDLVKPTYHRIITRSYGFSVHMRGSSTVRSVSLRGAPWRMLRCLAGPLQAFDGAAELVGVYAGVALGGVEVLVEVLMSEQLLDLA